MRTGTGGRTGELGFQFWALVVAASVSLRTATVPPGAHATVNLFESSRPALKAAASCRSSSLGSGGSAGSWVVLVCLSQWIFLCFAWTLLLSSSLWLSRLPLCSILHQSILCGVGGIKLSGDLSL